MSSTKKKTDINAEIVGEIDKYLTNFTKNGKNLPGTLLPVYNAIHKHDVPDLPPKAIDVYDENFKKNLKQREKRLKSQSKL